MLFDILPRLPLWSSARAQRDNVVGELRTQLQAVQAERDALRAQVAALEAELAAERAAHADVLQMFDAECRRGTHGKHQ